MKKAEVEIGATYIVKVSGKLAPVKITGQSPYGGWDGRNLDTRRDIRIRSAQRLRRPVTLDGFARKLGAAARDTEQAG